MDFLQPTTWADVLEAKAERPGVVPIAGGTDLMVGLNFGEKPPEALLDLTHVADLAEWDRSDGVVRFGAGVPYARIIADLGSELPALAIASRTVGSPQIRNRATVAGNLGTASPAGNAHPPLLATGATVEANRSAALAHPDRRLLPRRQTAGARRRRTDPRGTGAGRARAAAVREDRHSKRHGDRRLHRRGRARPQQPPGRHGHRLRGAHASAGPRRGELRRRIPSLGRRNA